MRRARSYFYDSLNNLLDVHQGNQQQDRQFSYDSLSRLVTAFNPESGTTSYSYDGNGNMLTRTRPAPNQIGSGRTVTTFYSYDELNRVTRKYFSDGVTPEVHFVYDQGSVSLGGSPYALSNTNGRLAYAFVPNSTVDIYSYDLMGRVTDVRQCAKAPCTSTWDAQHIYDLGGDLLTLGYNGGATLTYAYDNSQRITNVTTNQGLTGLSPTLFSPTPGQQQYGSVGLLNATLGTGTGALAETRTYNNRTWLNSLTVGSGPVYSLTNLTYWGNGDVHTANDSVNGNWTYGYDDFNRLSSAAKAGVSLTFDYDRLGNRWNQNQAGQGSISLTFDGNNRINNPGYLYDAAGNLAMDNLYCYTYDAENRLIAVAPETGFGTGICAATTMNYLYDPDGRRVARLENGSIVKQYYYDAAGHMITEANASGNTLRAEIYAGSRHLATWSNSATFFNHSDWLGTERARTNSSGALCWAQSSLPFGDGVAIINNNCTPTPTFFTGKERDSESGLDYFGARYNASSLGRFMTPDPAGKKAAKLNDPQTWNMYPYVRNNPLTLTDPTGLFAVACSSDYKTCQRLAKKLDTALQQTQKSKSDDVRKAGQAYGTLGDMNGVTVTFANMVDEKHPDVLGAVTALPGTGGAIYDENSKTFRQATEVTLKAGLGGTELENTVIHEGVHIENRESVVASVNGTYDKSLNITGRQSEVNAYGVENIFRRSIGLPLLNIQDILAHPPYSDNPNIDKPLFPDLPAPQ